MENNDIYYKKYMKYKLKYLNLLNSYQSDTSKSFNASKVMDGGLNVLPNVAKVLPKVLPKVGKVLPKNKNVIHKLKIDDQSISHSVGKIKESHINKIIITKFLNELLKNLDKNNQSIIGELLSKLSKDKLSTDELVKTLTDLIKTNDSLKKYLKDNLDKKEILKTFLTITIPDLKTILDNP
jgi:Glu-tRNA(Gln) amidotransferase subunit E-like FAD-binding protein